MVVPYTATPNGKIYFHSAVHGREVDRGRGREPPYQLLQLFPVVWQHRPDLYEDQCREMRNKSLHQETPCAQHTPSDGHDHTYNFTNKGTTSHASYLHINTIQVVVMRSHPCHGLINTSRALDRLRAQLKAPANSTIV